jgi:hypothetical protein
MKKYIIIGLTILATVVLYAQLGITIYTGKALNKGLTGTRIDTTSLYNFRNYEVVELLTTAKGSDSIMLYNYFDGYYNNQYVTSFFVDSLKKYGTAGSLGRGTLLRGYGTNNIKGYDLGRFRVVPYTFADSASPMSYSMRIIGR